jgi:hypothetical protein|tara:strand:+ start:131 stop:349 length:219 start_codon:yes stop_codon:yes gene_type:complete
MRQLQNGSIAIIVLLISIIMITIQVKAETPIENKPKAEKTETNPCWYVESFTFDTIGAPKHDAVVPKKCEDE